MGDEGGGRAGPRSEHESAFEQVFEATYRDVVGYCRRRTGSLDDADDVVAATYLVAWRRFPELQKAETPLAWLYAVAYRTLANQRRTALRARRLVKRLGTVRPAVPPDDPARLVAGNLELEAVQRAIARLPQLDQELLRLNAFEQMGYEDMASVVGRSVPAVRSRLHRARKQLQRQFERERERS